jgi:hypothetical protein
LYIRSTWFEARAVPPPSMTGRTPCRLAVALVIPSFGEGFGLALFETMAYSKVTAPAER